MRRRQFVEKMRTRDKNKLLIKVVYALSALVIILAGSLLWCIFHEKAEISPQDIVKNYEKNVEKVAELGDFKKVEANKFVMQKVPENVFMQSIGEKGVKITSVMSNTVFGADGVVSFKSENRACISKFVNKDGSWLMSEVNCYD